MAVSIVTMPVGAFMTVALCIIVIAAVAMSIFFGSDGIEAIQSRSPGDQGDGAAEESGGDAGDSAPGRPGRGFAIAASAMQWLLATCLVSLAPAGSIHTARRDLSLF